MEKSQAAREKSKEGTEVNRALIVLFVAVGAFGQGGAPRVIARNPAALPLPDRSTPPANARYEVVQSPIFRQAAFLLDRFTGKVMELTADPAGRLSWQLMRVIGSGLTPASKTPKFQIVFLSNPFEHTLLVDVDGGASWQFATDDEYQVGKWVQVAFDVIGAPPK